MESAKNNLQLIDTSSEVSNQEKAFLIHGTDKIPIYAENTSRYSLSFRYSGGQHHNQPDEPVRLLIKNNGDSVELGPCRILSDTNLNGYGGRLVFTNEVYDFECLLRKNKILKLQAPFSDLPHVMARKDAIRSSFKEYTADLTYDLSVYKKLFDDLDLKYCEEPDEVRTAVQKAIIESEGPDFRRFFEDKLDELKNLVDDFSQEEHQLHGFYFRKQLWNYILSCPFTARATLKPRGYAGDSELMRMVYLNDYQGDSTFSKITHKHAVEHTASQSVRYRKTLITQMLHKSEKFLSLPSPDKFKVLSVGCGSAFELEEILKSPQDCANYKFTLFDQDSAALSEAAEVANAIEKKIGAAPAVAYVQGSVRLILFSRKLKQKWGQFHFIYSMGLFDYLNARVATAVLDRLYRLLKPEGELVVGNFHVSNSSKYYMQYWGDWVLLHRTKEEFKGLFQNNSCGKVSVLHDDTGSQMFLHVKKSKTSV
jgi:extracellular factor (EF) 3-hydroxypalmitic acid methyl ester biosynthesis protein